jgi:hypothetical protein
VGNTFLHAFAIIASENAREIAGIDEPSSRHMQLRAACAIANNRKGFPQVYVSIFWFACILGYYVNILDKRCMKADRAHSSSFIYRLVANKLGFKLALFDDYEEIWKARQTWAKRRNNWLKSTLCVLADIEAAYLALKSSHFADVPWLLFILVLSWVMTADLWVSSGTPAVVRDRQGFIGFGQIVTLALLIIPLLSAGEAYLAAAEDDAAQNSNATLA